MCFQSIQKKNFLSTRHLERLLPGLLNAWNDWVGASVVSGLIALDHCIHTAAMHWGWDGGGGGGFHILPLSPHDIALVSQSIPLERVPANRKQRVPASTTEAEGAGVGAGVGTGGTYVDEAELARAQDRVRLEGLLECNAAYRARIRQGQ